MIKEAIEKILGLAKPEIIELDGKKYCKDNLKHITNPDYRPDNLDIHTLTGIVDYVKQNIENIDTSELFLHIENYDSVKLYGKFEGETSKRTLFLSSTLDNYNRFPFGQYLNSEQFLINLQTLFVPSEELDVIKGIAAGIKKQDNTEVQDNGISQTVALKTGVHLAENVKIPNPINLQPHRTFREIAQPASSFIFRIRAERMPECALYEADGSVWKLDAMEKIKAYFNTHLPDILVLG
jgi:hypothetical protein